MNTVNTPEGQNSPLRAFGNIRRTRQDEKRDALILANLPLVGMTASRILTYRPAFLPYFDYADAYSHGVMGLISAVDRYKLGHGAQFRSFAILCIRRAIQTYLRNAAKDRRRYVDISEYIDTIPDNKDGPTAIAEYLQGVADLRQAVERLPEREQIVLALHYKDNATFVTIGRALGVSQTRAVQLHRQAIKRLALHLEI